jgi:2-(3-amino-3-carboxypropyl)histidine synthase
MKPPKIISEVEQEYELEIEKIAEIIKKQKTKKILLQFPDGLKQYSTLVQDKIIEELKIKHYQEKFKIFIWLDSCFGACDIPIETEKLGIDLIVQFGHSDWDYSKEKGIKVLK